MESSSVVKEKGCGATFGLTYDEFDRCNSFDEFVKAVCKKLPDTTKVSWDGRHWTADAASCSCFICCDETCDDGLAFDPMCHGCRRDVLLVDDKFECYRLKHCDECEEKPTCSVCGYRLSSDGSCMLHNGRYDDLDWSDSDVDVDGM